MTLAAVAMMLAASLSTAVAQLAFKRATPPRTGRMVALGVVLYAMSVLLVIAAYRFGELTHLGPLLSLSVVWTVLLAVRFLGEEMWPRRWLGVMLIVAGSIAVTACGGTA